MPALPAAASRATDTEGLSFTSGHHFQVASGTDPQEVIAAAVRPLSVILQVTKRCDFDCSFCSETLQLPDPTIDQLSRMRDNLAGVPRVFLSGGEPLMRRDFSEVVDLFTGQHIIGVSVWDGDPVNAEPDKCAGLVWVNPDSLPSNTIGYTAAGLRAYRDQTPFVLDGWLTSTSM